MNSLKNTPVRRVAAVAALLAAVAGAASARAQQEHMGGSFDQPLNKAGSGAARSGGSVTTMMSQSDDEHTYTVRIEGNKVSAEVDGKALPKNRVVRKGDRVELLDADKNVMKTFNVPAASTLNMTPRFRVETVPQGGRAAVAPRAWGQGQAQAEVAEQPRAMMGIMMSDAGDDEGAEIDSVLDGMPAANAGLEAGDRIVEVDGKKIAGQQELRDLIREKQPGDVLKVKAVRDGKAKEYKIALAKYESRMIGQPSLLEAMGAERGAELEAAKAQLEKVLATLKEQKLDEKARAKVEKALEMASNSIDKARLQMQLHIEAMPQHMEAMKLFGNNGQQFWAPMPPEAPEAPMLAQPDMSRQLDKISEQLEKLNKRIDSLEKKNR